MSYLSDLSGSYSGGSGSEDSAFRKFLEKVR